MPTSESTPMRLWPNCRTYHSRCIAGRPTMSLASENPRRAAFGRHSGNGQLPGKARNIEELRQDILTATSLIPGRHRLSLHASYADFRSTGAVDRDALRPEHFASWMDWAEANGMKLDFNSTSFSHPKSGMLTLSNPDEGIRRFWVEHTNAAARSPRRWDAVRATPPCSTSGYTTARRIRP